MKNFILLFCVLVGAGAQAQVVKDKEAMLLSSETWYEGSIMLTDGKEFKGMIRYDDNKGFVSYHDGTSSHVYRPKSVLGFEFFDESVKKQRVFYTFETDEHGENSLPTPQFFELLRQYKTFAILLKVSPMEVEQRTINLPTSNQSTVPGGPRSGVLVRSEHLSQERTIYIMDDAGKLTSYISNETSIGVRKNLLSKKNDVSHEMHDKDLLEDYVTPEIYKKLKAYASSEKLKFKREEDLMKILDYYDTLIK